MSALRFASLLAAFAVALVALPRQGRAAPEEVAVTVGSKAFAESWILGEALAALARSEGARVDHRRNLGGTEILWQALTTGAVDVYPEYTGTIAEVILGTKERPSDEALRAELARRGVGMSSPLGFENGYAIAVPRPLARARGLATISDLSRHPDLRAIFTHEFLGRSDGYPGLAAAYGLTLEAKGIQHELAYEALAQGHADVTDIYTTDPQIERLDLVLLEDDRRFFSRYDAVLLYRLDLPSRAPRPFAAMSRLAGALDEARMRKANALVAGGETSPESAGAWLLASAHLGGEDRLAGGPSKARAIGHALLRHVELVFFSLLFAVAFGVPLGVVATRSRPLAAATLGLASVVQTIPSLALLAFLIPVFGIGTAPALAALLLYGLLPIVRNTFVGLTSIPSSLTEAAEAIGLSPRDRLLYVALPLASPMILAGIKTSAVINVGTATIAALVGAGGLGEAILEGIALRRTSRILEGAVPAALLALAVQWAFGLLDRWLVPRGLRPSR